jgi:hypothetical protein
VNVPRLAGSVLNLTQKSIVKSPVPKYQSAESGVERYWLELATNLPLAPPKTLCEVSMDAPPLDVIALGSTIWESVEVDVVVTVVVVFVVSDPIVNV